MSRRARRRSGSGATGRWTTRATRAPGSTWSATTSSRCRCSTCSSRASSSPPGPRLEPPGRPCRRRRRRRRRPRTERRTHAGGRGRDAGADRRRPGTGRRHRGRVGPARGAHRRPGGQPARRGGDASVGVGAGEALRARRRRRAPRGRLARRDAVGRGAAGRLGLAARPAHPHAPAHPARIPDPAEGPRPRALRRGHRGGRPAPDEHERRLRGGQGGGRRVDAGAGRRAERDRGDGQPHRRQCHPHAADARGEPRQGVQDLHVGRGHRRGDRLRVLRRGGQDERQAPGPAPLKGFGSDNHAGVLPAALEAIAAANVDHAPSYGNDPWTARAEERFREHFGEQARAFIVFNGTGAIVVGLRALLRPYEGVVCADTAHLNVDECGAPEFNAGIKLLAVPTPDGKLTPELVAPRLVRFGDEHAIQPGVISITQSTELGTVYSLDELRALSDLAHEQGLLLHVDGARLANAAVALDVPLRALTTDAGVDALSFGGTKNGLLAGEAIVLLRPGVADALPYLRKQSMQLASKMRFLAAQFEALLDGDAWQRAAAHANAMAARLGEAVAGVPGVTITQRVEANAVFAIVPPAAAKRLRERWFFYTWAEATGEVRWMCAWDTTPDDVDAFAAAVAEEVAAVAGAA